MKFEKMTKAQIIEKIESIPADMLNSAVTAIRYSNPLNVISTNRVNVYIRSNRVIKIEFQSRATKQNMIAVYTEILDRIAVYYGIEEVHNIEAEYTPVWWEDDTNEDDQETKKETEEDSSSAPSANSEAQEATNTNESESEEEQTMKKPSFIIKCIQFHHDENFKMIGNPIYREFAGSTLKEAKAAWRAARDNNDVVKFSPLTIYDIINSEEE